MTVPIMIAAAAIVAGLILTNVRLMREIRCFLWLLRIGGWQPIRAFRHVWLGKSWWIDREGR